MFDIVFHNNEKMNVLNFSFSESDDEQVHTSITLSNPNTDKTKQNNKLVSAI